MAEEIIVGVDEAGRGPLAGCVVACALTLPNQPPFTPRDSKELTPLARQEMFAWLASNAVFSVALATPAEIDQHNILQATFITFSRAIEGLVAKADYLRQAKFIIDGPLFRTHLPIRYTCVKRADKIVPEVSCASVIAKVARDYFMYVADFLYPEWSFSVHKGYPTDAHVRLVGQHPLTPLHRRSFSWCNR